MTKLVLGIPVIIDFDCPLCHTKIPTEYMAKKTDMLTIRGVSMLACIGCNKKWKEQLEFEAELMASEGVAAQLGMDPKQWVKIRRERQEMQKEDEAKIDDEVDIFDVKKAKRLFREKWDKFGLVSPIQGMRKNFMRGMRKELQGKLKIQIKGGLSGSRAS